jgi:hypothetical protein
LILKTYRKYSKIINSKSNKLKIIKIGILILFQNSSCQMEKL